MTTIAAKPGAIRTPAAAAARRSQRVRPRVLTITAIGLILAGLAIGTWLTSARGAGQATPVSAAMPAPTWAPFASPWLQQLEVRDLRRQLVRAGYQVKVDGSLDPITKSALADYLQPGSASSVGLTLAGPLSGTVILGRHNPVAWNSRFGLNRATKFVERPLTGPGGQLDENGNVRVP